VKSLFLLLSTLKLGKILMSAGTMLLSVFTYALVFGWLYAVGFVLMIFAHEMGHYIAARQRNLDVGLPTFIPFVGAWIQLKEFPHDVETEAYVGIAGPVSGTIAAIICYFIAVNQGSQLLLAISYAGFFINLFNLIPISPLDGGRITAVISRKIWWIGVPVLIAAFIYTHSPLLIMVAILAVPRLIESWKNNQSDGDNETYFEATIEHKVIYALWYFGLIILLTKMCVDVHALL